MAISPDIVAGKPRRRKERTTADVLEFADAAEWESWLAAQHDERAEAWLRIDKRHSGTALITIA